MHFFCLFINPPACILDGADQALSSKGSGRVKTERIALSQQTTFQTQANGLQQILFNPRHINRLYNPLQNPNCIDY